MSGAYDYPPGPPLRLTPGTGLAAVLLRGLEIQSYIAAHYADQLIIDYPTRKKIAAAALTNVADLQGFIAEYRIDIARRKPKKLRLCKSCEALRK